MAYSELLRSAYVRTRARSYPVPRIRGSLPPLPAHTLLGAAWSLADLTRSLARDIAAPGSCDLAHRCAALMLAAKPRVERALGCEVVLTLGSIDYQGITILSANSEDLQELRRRASYHVWWSVGAHQVVDLTLMTHLALLKEAAPPAILPIVGAPDEIAHIRWRPHLIGDAVIEALTGASLPAFNP